MDDYKQGDLVTGVKGSFYHGQDLHFNRFCTGDVMKGTCYVQDMNRYEFPVELDEIMYKRDIAQEKNFVVKYDCIEYPATKEQYDNFHAALAAVMK